MRTVLSITTVVLSLLFVYLAARAVTVLNLELIDETGTGKPFLFGEWALLILAPLLLIAVGIQSLMVMQRRRKTG